MAADSSRETEGSGNIDDDEALTNVRGEAEGNVMSDAILEKLPTDGIAEGENSVPIDLTFEDVAESG